MMQYLKKLIYWKGETCEFHTNNRRKFKLNMNDKYIKNVFIYIYIYHLYLNG